MRYTRKFKKLTSNVHAMLGTKLKYGDGRTTFVLLLASG